MAKRQKKKKRIWHCHCTQHCCCGWVSILAWELLHAAGMYLPHPPNGKEMERKICFFKIFTLLCVHVYNLFRRLNYFIHIYGMLGCNVTHLILLWMPLFRKWKGHSWWGIWGMGGLNKFPKGQIHSGFGLRRSGPGACFSLPLDRAPREKEHFLGKEWRVEVWDSDPERTKVSM